MQHPPWQVTENILAKRLWISREIWPNSTKQQQCQLMFNHASKQSLEWHVHFWTCLRLAQSVIYCTGHLTPLAQHNDRCSWITFCSYTLMFNNIMYTCGSQHSMPSLFLKLLLWSKRVGKQQEHFVPGGWGFTLHFLLFRSFPAGQRSYTNRK